MYAQLPDVVQEMSAHSAPPPKSCLQIPVCTNGSQWLLIATIKETMFKFIPVVTSALSSLRQDQRKHLKSVGIAAVFSVPITI